MFNVIIRYLLEQYIEITLCSLVSLHYIAFDSEGNTLAALIGFISLVFVIWFPYYGYNRSVTHYLRIGDDNYYNKYGTFYEE